MLGKESHTVFSLILISFFHLDQNFTFIYLFIFVDRKQSIHVLNVLKFLLIRVINLWSPSYRFVVKFVITFILLLSLIQFSF